MKEKCNSVFAGFLVFCFVLSLNACRKDLLRFKKAERLETHTSTDQFNKIFFLNDSVGFIVGGQRFFNSTVLRTEDGGKSWSYQNIEQAPKALYGITQSPDGTLLAIGFDGKLLSSSDLGMTWEFQQLHYLPYKDIAMFDENRGALIGGISFNQGFLTNIYSDGNYSGWDSLAFELNDIELINGKSGYITAHGTILKTIDSGRTWQVLPIENDNFKAIQVINEEEAWTCGYNGSIFRTRNGGRSWERLRNGNDLKKPRYKLLTIAFRDAQHGYAAGENGLLIYTDDGGKHWMEFERFTNSTLRSLFIKKDGSVLVCGEQGSLYHIIPEAF